MNLVGLLMILHAHMEHHMNIRNLDPCNGGKLHSIFFIVLPVCWWPVDQSVMKTAFLYSEMESPMKKLLSFSIIPSPNSSQNLTHNI